MNCYTGCSGFYYPEWKGTFYPDDLKKKDWLNYYSGFFNTLEINNTFYRFPELKTFSGWYEKSPEGFRFSVKVPRIITQYRRFNDCAELLADFYSFANDGLKEKLGCILFQLPPSMVYSAEMLEKIIANVNPNFRNIIEFRHISWFDQTVYEALKLHNITFCSVSYPKMPDHVIVTSDLVYYRFHGVPELYKSAYSPEKLEMVATEILQANPEESWIYFNNTMNVEAIQNALSINKMLASKQ